MVHTNFTGTAPKVYNIRLLEFKDPDNLEILRAVFHDPTKLRPGATREAITQQAAERLATLADRLRGRGLDPHKVARFLDRIVFCLFAEDIGLLPENTFAQILEEYRQEPEQFTAAVAELFARMASGGRFGVRRVKHFDGDLFEHVEVLALEYADGEVCGRGLSASRKALDETEVAVYCIGYRHAAGISVTGGSSPVACVPVEDLEPGAVRYGKSESDATHRAPR